MFDHDYGLLSKDILEMFRVFHEQPIHNYWIFINIDWGGKPKVGISWMSPGSLLGFSWGSPGCLLVSPGCLLDLLGVFWESPGCLPVSPGCLLGVSWESPGSLLGVSWCLLGVSW